jgi:hypothetical protein
MSDFELLCHKRTFILELFASLALFRGPFCNPLPKQIQKVGNFQREKAGAEGKPEKRTAECFG